MSVDVKDFRAAVGCFATGVSVVSTSLDGLDHAMTVNAFSSVSLDPLLVLFCVDRSARFSEAVASAGVWGVSVLDDTAEETSRWLAHRGRRLPGQLDRVPHRRGPVTGVPLLQAALATLECRTTDTHPGGDHIIVVGEVLAVDLPRPEAVPLLWFRGSYHSLSLNPQQNVISPLR